MNKKPKIERMGKFTSELGEVEIRKQGTCMFCGKWPTLKVLYDIGDENQPAKLVQRYCDSCWQKNKALSK